MPSTWAFSSFYSVFLRPQGTNNFSLLPPQSSCCDSCLGAGRFLFLHSFFLLVRPSWKSLADFLFTRSLQAANLSYLVLFMISAFLAAFHSCHFSQIVRIFCCWFEVLFPLLLPFFCFSHFWFLAIQLLCPWMFALHFSDPSLHDWTLEIQFFSSTVGI